MELNGFPLYASANSVASEGLKNFKTTNERFGAKSLEESCRLDNTHDTIIVSHTGLCEDDRCPPQRVPQMLGSPKASSMTEQREHLA
jgi:hypothetical protein